MEVRIPRDEGPRALTVGAVGAVALIVGLSLAWWGMEEEPASESASESESENAPASSPPAPSREREGEDPAPEPASETPSQPEPEPAPTTRHVRQGQVAYLRCEGLRRCPRDEALEEAVWTIVDRITTCPGGPRTTGEADLRIDYTANTAPDIAWRDTFPSTTVRLEEEAVLGCLRQPLRTTRQNIGAQRLILSFRFAIE